jgi:hypothetical protein
MLDSVNCFINKDGNYRKVRESVLVAQDEIHQLTCHLVGELLLRKKGKRKRERRRNSITHFIDMLSAVYKCYFIVV